MPGPNNEFHGTFSTNPDGAFDYSFNSPQSDYGEDFVESLRKSRSNFGYEDRRRSIPDCRDLFAQDHRKWHQQGGYGHAATSRINGQQAGTSKFERCFSDVIGNDNMAGMECLPPPAQCSTPAPPVAHQFSEAEIYLIGSLRVPLGKFAETLEKYPPPPQYYRLPAVEKVAFVFYAALWERPYYDIDVFHKQFNREFYNFTANGVEDEEALYRICSEMQGRYLQLMKKQKVDALKQSFQERDDRRDPTEDGYQDKENVPNDHGGVGRRRSHLIQKPLFASPKIQIDGKTKRLIDTIQMFRGPLHPQTPSHQVTLYIERQIAKIIRADLGHGNAATDALVDCLVLWQLLHTIVQQHGKVTGPDMARLLLANGARVAPVEAAIPILQNAAIDEESRKAFDDYLLKGHIEEAIELAVKYDMFAEALLLARRVSPSKLDEIEMQYIGTRLHDQPMTTLLTVAANHKPPVLVSPPVDDFVSWRTHTAIVLANLNTPCAMSTIYEMGKFLATKNCHAAADFCFLAVALLNDSNVFAPPANGTSGSREHISLLNASLPNDEENSTNCAYGFSLTDLHATEIFAYGLSLSKGYSPLAGSIEFQSARVKYAQLLADLGLPRNAFGFATGIAAQIWDNYNLFPATMLNELCSIAEHTLTSNEDPKSAGTWIPELRNRIATLGAVPIPQIQPENLPTPTIQSPHYQAVQRSTVPMTSDTGDNVSDQRENTSQPDEAPSTVVASGSSESGRPAKPSFSIQTMEGSTNPPQTPSCAPPSRNAPETEREPGTPSVAETVQVNLAPTPSVPLQTHAPANLSPIKSNVNAPEPKPDQSPKSKGSRDAQGWLTGLKSTLATKFIRGRNEVHLPDDSNKKIVYDEKLGRWLGEGVEEEEAPPPPPAVRTSPTRPLAQSRTAPAVSGLLAARSGNVPRYYNGFGSSSVTKTDNVPPPDALYTPPTQQFGFIPRMPDSDPNFDPFSPALPEVKVESSQC
ncbi:unnamed protein product, partial [Mesorhabditis spiculigera]